MNPARRLPYEDILDHDNYHHVSPAYAKRFQKTDETEEQYVERLRKELEDKFIELGPETVVGCKQMLLLIFGELMIFFSCRRASCRCDYRSRPCSQRVF